MALDSNRVSLISAISGLRKELREAAEQAEGLGPEEPKFRITSVELELTVVAEDSISAGGEVGWWVLKGRADTAVKDAATHRVKLTLNVGDIKVSSDRTTGPGPQRSPTG